MLISNCPKLSKSCARSGLHPCFRGHGVTTALDERARGGLFSLFRHFRFHQLVADERLALAASLGSSPLAAL